MSTQTFNISMQNMQSAFEKIEKEAGWDTSKKMYWGYYFLDHDLKKIEGFAKKLKEFGYQIVEIRQVESATLFLLHAENHVVHSPQTLFSQCQNLAKLAAENEIEVFDGWDVEKIQMNKGLVE